MPGKLRQTSQVLCRRRERELVEGPREATQPQPVEPQDPLEVGEQHLDLLS